MKRNLIVLAIVLILAALFTSLGGCGKKSPSTTTTTDSGPAINTTSTEARQKVFALYDKVQLNQTKIEVDAALGTGKQDESYDKAYNYMDKDNKYGVSVIFNDSHQATSKTAIYQTHKELAPLTGKAVTRAQSNQILKGMKYDEVKAVLGSEGVEVSATQIPFENKKVSYILRWANTDGSCIQVVLLTDGTVGNVLYFDEQRM